MGPTPLPLQVQGGIGGVLGGWVSALHVARQLKASPMRENPEESLFYGGAGQFVDHLAKVGGRAGGAGGSSGHWRVQRV